jgi:beta-glucosidase
VVSVFLSGRPLWTRPEIEASNAFVAARLPGSQGGGIADLLVGDTAGRPRFDFRGRLSFAWPNGATPPLGARRAGAGRAGTARDTLPLGFGLHYPDTAQH